MQNLTRRQILLTWELKSIDPQTGDIPLDPSVGILPPNINPPEGEGSVMFVVMPEEGYCHWNYHSQSGNDYIRS